MREQLLPISWEKGMGRGWFLLGQQGVWRSPSPCPRCEKGPPTHCFSSTALDRPPTWARPSPGLEDRTCPVALSPKPGCAQTVLPGTALQGRKVRAASATTCFSPPGQPVLSQGLILGAQAGHEGQGSALWTSILGVGSGGGV